ncbi:MAG TPA: dihydroorotate dehydrogenase electron transfer subunit [Deltaproteobacteria bacterium]|nr:dihydroorotate dehydrogenase electron transfer subunit [Deltaproteobacteria bacterium]
MEQMRKRETGIVRSNRETARGHYVIEVELPGLFGVVNPGQFVMFRPGAGETPLLSRPFSVCSQTETGETTKIELLYRVVGAGTARMASLRQGDTVNVLGPLGRGFDMDEGRRVILVAGGVGVAPLISYADRRRAQEEGGRVRIIAYVGAADEESIAGVDRLEQYCDEVKIATDDGSRGFRGTVTELFRTDVEHHEKTASAVRACGPRAMLSALADVLDGHDIVCQVSMEERMACGIGACLGCAVRVRLNDGSVGYRRVCKDGPVFDMEDIDWHED